MLAAAGIAEQHEAWVTVQLLQRREPAGFFFENFAAPQALVHFRRERQQRRINAVEVQAGFSLAGDVGINPGE